MKIAVIGAKGFIGSSLSKYLKSHYHVTEVTRQTLDLLDCMQVKDFLKSNMFDVVIDCAATMTDNNSIFDARNNLGIFMNFYNNSNYFGKFINTGSGAEFDRTTNINLAKEYDIFNHLPSDSYGFGQNIKSRLCFEKNHFYTLRIFNCFGFGEKESRIFPSIIRSKNFIDINNDRYFDYFFIDDLYTVIENCISHDWAVNDVNCVYEFKYKISEIAHLFCKYNNLNLKININSSCSNNYTGCYKNINSLDLRLKGLEFGLKNYITK